MTAGYHKIPEELRIRLDPRSAEFYRNPYNVYADWHHSNPVFYWENYNLWCICGFNDVSQILRNPRFGRQITHLYSREELGLPQRKSHLKDFYQLEQFSLLNLEAPSHTRLRKFVTHVFTHRRVQSLETTIRSLANKLLVKIEQNSAITQEGRMSTAGSNPSCDLLAQYAAPLAASVIARLVGAPDSSIPDLLRWSHQLVRVYTLTQTYEEELAANQAAIEFREFLLQLIEERRRQPADDLISLLLQAGDVQPGSSNKPSRQDAPTDDEIVSVIVLLLNAGHEATVHQIGNATRLLLTGEKKPSEYFLDEQAGKNTVQELMRVDTPLHLFTRYALEPVSLEFSNNLSLQLAPGEEVALLLGAANHDPDVFESPAQFNPDRPRLDSVSLGAGTHFCVGALLAQQEIRIALESLFAYFPSLQLAEVPEFADTYHFRGLGELRVTW